MTETFRFDEFDIPEHLSVFVGSVGGKVFAKVAEEQLILLHQLIGLSPDHVIFEVGCGPAKAAIPIAKMLSSSARYLGVDVSKEVIQWCEQNVTPRYPNVKFVHVDVKSSMYNSAGQMPATQIRFPLDDKSVDRIFLFSVFTHMLEGGIRHYLDEFKRVLKPDGRALVTWFIIEDGVLESARAKPGPIGNLTFRYPVADGCYANDVKEVLGAVAYDRPYVEKMISEAGLEIEKLIHGYWSQFWGPSVTGQDITLLRNPG